MSSEQLSQLASEPAVEEVRQSAPGDDSASPKTVPHPQSSQDSQDSQDSTGSEMSSLSKSSDGSIDTLACPSPVIEADGYIRGICEPPRHQGGQNPTVVHHHYHKDKFSFVSFKTEEIHHDTHHHHHVTHVHHHYHFVGGAEEKVAGSLLALGCRFLRIHSEMGVPTQVDPVPQGGWGSHPGALEQCTGTQIIESDLEIESDSDRPTKLRRMNAAYFSDPEGETIQVKDG